MKNVTTIFAGLSLVLISTTSFGQGATGTDGVSIAPWNVPPHDAAMLEVISSNKGVSYPRMTYTEMGSISPAASADALQVYVTAPEKRRGLWFYDHSVTKWVRYGIDVELLAPANMVIMVAGACPTGWAPVADLEGRSIIGTDDTNPDYSPGMQGGERTHALTVAEIPDHYHTFTGTANTFSVAPSSHNHQMDTRDNGTSIGRWRMSGYKRGGSLDETGETDGTIPVQEDSHSHAVKGDLQGQSDGGSGLNGAAHNNMPPYHVLQHCIKNW